MKSISCKYFIDSDVVIDKLDNAKRGIPSQGGKVHLDL